MIKQATPPGPSDDLIKLIHQGPLERTPMASVIAALRLALKARFIGLTLQQPALVRPLLLHLQDSEFDDDAFMERYLNRYAEDDPFPYHQLEPYRIYNATELLGPCWREGEYYRQFLQPYGLHEVLLVRLEVVGSLNAYLFAIRSEGQPKFSVQETALLERLLPDLSQALDVSRASAVLKRSAGFTSRRSRPWASAQFCSMAWARSSTRICWRPC